VRAFLLAAERAMNWEAVGSIAAVTSLIAGAFTWLNRFVVRDIVREEVQKINGTYLKSMGSTLTGMELERWREATERRLEALEE
jgi:hypothetical protein